MNLRILKKLSKRAASYLPLLGDNRQQFPAEPYDNYHGLVIQAKKHWDRHDAVHGDVIRSGEGGYAYQPACRTGTRFPFIHVVPPLHPWAGTIMVGAMQGYYEPEWDEESAWGALCTMVFGEFTDWDAYARDDHTGRLLTRRLRTPADIFRAADEMIAERSKSA
ncbi:hypothetical protein [Sphingobium cupriresistens]|uniref:hypothetical protein n=1 Tax=Sphingobium cupriresistens TaxID=1132417 RepID=UPI003BADC792